MDALHFLEEELRSLEAASLLRQPSPAAERAGLEAAALERGRHLIDLSSNDYLGYAGRSVSRETLDACSGLPLGAGSSRLLAGTRDPHDALEAALASWVTLPTALVFSSGYAANVGTLSALARPDHLIVSDALNHASLIDGCRLSGARVSVVPHLDLDAAEDALRRAPERHRWVVTESYFSMDADTPDLPALRALCDRHGAALVVDEAHALGVFGPSGAGLCAASSVIPDVLIGTLGKALGTQGAFVATTTHARTWLWNRARSFVFSTAVSPLLADLTRRRLSQVQGDDDGRSHLLHSAALLARLLRERGLSLPTHSHGPVLPVLLGDSARAVAAARALLPEDILAMPIRPPTVPAGTARLRLSLTTRVAHGDLLRIAIAISDACRLPPVSSPPDPP